MIQIKEEKTGPGISIIVNITILVLPVNAAGCFILSPEDYAMLYVIVVDCIK
jgi:hypothetical protein